MLEAEKYIFPLLENWRFHFIIKWVETGRLQNNRNYALEQEQSTVKQAKFFCDRVWSRSFFHCNEFQLNV